MAQLPFTVTTATGTKYDIRFPLHAETQSPVRVGQLLRAMLDALDREIALDPNVGNGDVMQAAAMALAVRSAMIETPRATTDRLAHDLLQAALEGMDGATREAPTSGNA